MLTAAGCRRLVYILQVCVARCATILHESISLMLRCYHAQGAVTLRTARWPRMNPCWNLKKHLLWDRLPPPPPPPAPPPGLPASMPPLALAGL